MEALPLPKSQIQEVLYELLLGKVISRKTMPDVLNLTARIANLRNKYELFIVCENVKLVNKFQRDITYGKWHIPSGKAREKAIEVYKKLTNNGEK